MSKQTPHISIIGSGLGGIIAAIAVKKQLSHENFTIFDKEDEFGGTWRDNTYPGCGSDVPGHWYSLSSEMNPNWTSYYVSQPEIQAYWQGIVRKHNLRPKARLNSVVELAKWDSTAAVWRLTVRNTKTNETEEVVSAAIINAAGGFTTPAFPPDIKGQKDFEGAIFHSARWDHSLKLSGKRVAVIGNGCSSTQFIPEISNDPSVEVVNVCRTPSWFVPRLQFNYPTPVKWGFAHIPGLMWLHRTGLWASQDLQFVNWKQNWSTLRSIVEKRMRHYIKSSAPEEDVPGLLPDYPLGCKRIIRDPGYLKALRRPNVSVKWGGVDSLVKDGLRTGTGEHIPADVIIFGTGFEVGTVPLQVVGQGGKTLREYFASQGGPTAYLGTTVPGFPNFYFVLGPNTATGHASVIFTEECQVNYAMQLIKPVVQGKAKSFEVKAAASDTYNADLQQRLQKSTFIACSSYYHAAGTDGKGKVVAVFPGPVTLFWWWARKVNFGHYRVTGGQKWAMERVKEKRKRRLRLFVLAILGLLAYFRKDALREVLGKLRNEILICCSRRMYVNGRQLLVRA